MTSAAVSPINTPQIEPANFLNLLIVDDERSIREACREVAQQLGFMAYVADSAEHAFRLLETQAFDVVLLDLRLPGAGARNRRACAGNGEALSHHCQGGQQHPSGLDSGRERHGQGDGRAVDSLFRAIS